MWAHSDVEHKGPLCGTQGCAITNTQIVETTQIMAWLHNLIIEYYSHLHKGSNEMGT